MVTLLRPLGLVQPVLQMVSSDFVGRKEDSATLRREGDRSFSRFLCCSSVANPGEGDAFGAVTGNLTGDELTERAEGGNGVSGVAYATAEECGAEADERVVFCGP
jgi:hypothetical protein